MFVGVDILHCFSCWYVAMLKSKPLLLAKEQKIAKKACEKGKLNKTETFLNDVSLLF